MESLRSWRDPEEEQKSQAALGIDIRSGESLEELALFKEWDESRFPYEILFLDAGDEVLIKRYKETRRSHPLAGLDRLDRGIEKERRKLAFLKKRADYILDTSMLLTKELRIELEKIFISNEDYRSLYVTVLSFGFKYGIPVDADLVFDVRFLPNPYYVDELKSHTGNEPEVQEICHERRAGGGILEKNFPIWCCFCFPTMWRRGKNQLVIAIGCTWGKTPLRDSGQPPL